ncbi:hypothetical protein D9619_007099 [Psilocybe cf. subviscida]|uniref:F-box domain-containing protein n=1 Tax=Psilocybe cf. subviscida TaxID=2480587 RepID=A0A8H5B244_9AGAR|nr:hypothetical protein D9619_007099 [Psilocybe cf. subviscida]
MAVECTLTLGALPIDVIYEILGHLTVEDLLRTRRVCKKLFAASQQRNVWASIYQRSPLLLPDERISKYSSHELEAALIRASKVHMNWTRSEEPVFSRRRYPHELPTYNFAARVIAGRYLQVAERGGISWYDLDSGDIGTPVLHYPCSSIVPMAAYCKHQVNAEGGGMYSVWVTFLSSPGTLEVLKLSLGKSLKVELYATLPMQRTITSVVINHDWLLPIREFMSSSDLVEIFHIPSRAMMCLPMHNHASDPSDISNLHCVISARFLFVMFSARNETTVNVYTLPQTMPNVAHGAGNKLIPRSHCGVYPHVISSIKAIETYPSGRPFGTDATPHSVSFLALVYINAPHTTWTSKIDLHVLDAVVSPHGGTVDMYTISKTTLNAGIASTTLALSAREGMCMAVTHSSPGPLILAHHIERRGTECTMSMKTIKPPRGLQSREMVAMCGFRGRLCLIGGWTYIEILDCVAVIKLHST